jgi:FAD/FMN-containing dehydrogenase
MAGLVAIQGLDVVAGERVVRAQAGVVLADLHEWLAREVCRNVVCV